MQTYSFDTAQIRAYTEKLRAGDKVLLSGTVFTARDAAHKRFFSLLDEGKPLPFPLQDAVIYYAGPTGTPEHLAIGSCGPTTAGRMDPYAPRLLDLGLAGMIAKGERNDAVCQAVVRNKAVYFCALGGAGALASKCITRCDVIAFEELGCESVKKLQFQDFPLFVAVDCQGGNLFLDKAPLASL